MRIRDLFRENRELSVGNQPEALELRVAVFASSTRMGRSEDNKLPALAIGIFPTAEIV